MSPGATSAELATTVQTSPPVGRTLEPLLAVLLAILVIVLSSTSASVSAGTVDVRYDYDSYLAAPDLGEPTARVSSTASPQKTWQGRAPAEASACAACTTSSPTFVAPSELVPGPNGAMRDTATGRFAPNPDRPSSTWSTTSVHGNSRQSDQLLALRRSGFEPRIIRNVTSDAVVQGRVLGRLDEMGGAPSSTIRVRGAGRNASYLDWLWG